MGNSCRQLEASRKVSKLGNLGKQLRPTADNRGYRNLELAQLGIYYEAIETQYQIVYPAIGLGSSGNVFQIINKKTGAQLAAKKIKRKQAEFSPEIEKEVGILKKLNHPNILKLSAVYVDDVYIYIVTELCRGGELFDRIKKHKHFSETLAAKCMSQILEALQYCHNEGVTHRDLKPENIMFVTDQPTSTLKIIDFGTSQAANGSNSSKPCDKVVGTIYYISPEALRKEFVSKGDMWACGVILYVMLSGKLPFNSKCDKQICQIIMSGKYNISEGIWTNISVQAKSLIQGLLCLDSQKRLSASESLKSPWIMKYRQSSSNQSDAISYMQQLCQMKRLQVSVLRFLSANHTDQLQRKDLEQEFRLTDQDGDGRISYQKFRNVGNTPNNDQMAQKSKRLESSCSGATDYEEFSPANIHKNGCLTTHSLSQTFDKLDESHSGRLRTRKLQQALDGHFEVQQLRSHFCKCKFQDTGSLSKQEFVRAMQELFCR